MLPFCWCKKYWLKTTGTCFFKTKENNLLLTKMWNSLQKHSFFIASVMVELAPPQVESNIGKHTFSHCRVTVVLNPLFESLKAVPNCCSQFECVFLYMWTGRCKKMWNMQETNFGVMGPLINWCIQPHYCFITHSKMWKYPLYWQVGNSLSDWHIQPSTEVFISLFFVVSWLHVSHIMEAKQFGELNFITNW